MEVKRVLLMSQFLTAGGTERQLSIIARELDRSRFEPTVGCFRPDGIRHEELKAAGVRVVPFRIRSMYKPPPIGVAIELGQFLGRERIDLVHAFDVPTDVFAVPVARLFRVPYVLSSQRAHRTLASRVDRHLLRLSDSLVDGIVVNSRAVARELAEEEKVPESRIHLCYNAIDTSEFSPPPERAPEPLVIGAVGLFRPEKGHRTLIEAFARVHRAAPHTRLHLVGGGPLHRDLEELARQLGVADATTVEGSTPAVRERLQRMHIFVLPSLSEALSNALLEAMACGCCAVASRTGGNPEIIEENSSGLLFRPGDSDDLAGKLSALVADRAARERYACAGWKRVQQNFSLASSVNRMQEIYAGVMGV